MLGVPSMAPEKNNKSKHTLDLECQEYLPNWLNQSLYPGEKLNQNNQINILQLKNKSVLSIFFLPLKLTIPQHWQIFCWRYNGQQNGTRLSAMLHLTSQGSTASTVHVRPFNNCYYLPNLTKTLNENWLWALTPSQKHKQPNQFWITRHALGFEIR